MLCFSLIYPVEHWLHSPGNSSELFNLQLQLFNYISLSGRNREEATAGLNELSGRFDIFLFLPQQSPASCAANRRRQHRMVIYCRCSLLGCDLNFSNVTIQTPPPKKKNQKNQPN